MEQTRLQFLLAQYAEEKATGPELEELWGYIQSQGSSALFEEAGYALLEKERETDELPAAYTAILKNVTGIDKPEDTGVPEQQSVPMVRRLRWVAAAALIGALAIAAMWWVNLNEKAQPRMAEKQIAPIEPGREGAVLTLANGTKILLDTARGGTIALQGGGVAKVVNGALVYEVNGDEVVYNSMATPKGRQYRLMLPDGSAVWLNALSSISYPTVFKGKERKVSVSGEVYFEVVHDKLHPFVVEIDGGQTVTVLGTSFNINAYNDEQEMTTTLVEGKVKIAATSNADGASKAVVLTPGQQAICNRPSGNYAVAEGIKVLENADMQKVLAWKNGLFNFEGADLKTTMRQLARWYDFEVAYKGDVSTTRFRGKMYRNVEFKDVLDMLQRMEVNFEMKDRTMIIY